MTLSLTLSIFYAFSVIFALFGALYLYAQWNYGYWKRKNLPYLKPKFPYGSFVFGNKSKHISTYLLEDYERHKSQKCLGGFMFFTPMVMIFDVDLAKTVMGKDFQYFRDRGAYVNTRDDPLSGHLFNLEGDKWKIMREKLTAVFTSGKMKYMMPNIVKIGEELVKAMTQEAKIDATMDVKEYFARYTTDVIGTCAFGIECNSFTNPEAQFRQIGRKVLKISPFKQMFTFKYKKLSRALRLQLFAKDVTEFFVSAVQETVRYREANNIQRNDFLDLMIKLRNKEKSDDPKDEEMPGFSLAEIVAQSFVFFLAGFETSSTNMSFTCFELAMNPDIQEKARKHVQEVLRRHKNEFTYEAMQEMNFLEACINESLRKYPPAPFGFRKCSKDYKVPDSNFEIKKGMTIFLPFNAYHMDPDVFEEPEKFIPERFLKGEDGALKTPYGWMPFADGPRICIGMRFGMMQSKIGLAALLMNFKFRVSKKTEIPLKLNMNTGILQPLDLFLDVEKL